MESLEQIFSHKVDRKEFLIYLGVILLTVTGVLGTLKNLSNIQVGTQKNKITQTKGFGKGSYGA